jgi:phosphatidylethanolamine-binding protein (PEBP) family uncharacterized protein
MANPNLPSTLAGASLLTPTLGTQQNIIPDGFMPTLALNLTFPASASEATGSHIASGTLLRKAELAQAPEVFIDCLDSRPGDRTAKEKEIEEGEKKREGEGEERYTLMLLDPDAPTPADPKFGYWRHWIVTGLCLSTGSGDETKTEMGMGKTLSPWIAPGVGDACVSPSSLFPPPLFPSPPLPLPSSLSVSLSPILFGLRTLRSALPPAPLTLSLEAQTRTLTNGPHSANRSGPHRYLFLLFREPTDAKYAPTKDDVGGDEFVERRSFDAVGFVRRFGLELVALTWVWGVGDGWVA